MSPNQPKTPISGFRLDEETKDRIRWISEQMGTTMTGALKKMAEDTATAAGATAEMMKPLQKKAADSAEQMRRARIEDRRERSVEAVEALGAYIVDMEWPNATARERHVRHAPEAKRRAAAILNGEAWAIVKTWPQGAYDIRTRSDLGL